MTIWRQWGGIVTFALLCSLLVTGGMWVHTKQELERTMNISTEQHLAIDYCMSLLMQYSTSTWDFKTCLETAGSHPLETALGLYGDSRLPAEAKSALEQRMKNGTLSQ